MSTLTYASCSIVVITISTCPLSQQRLASPEELFNIVNNVPFFLLNQTLKKNLFIIKADRQKEEISFSISDFDRAIVLAGGWVEYADLKY